MKLKAKSGFAVAIAWPKTYCKQPGYWYDPILSLVGINKNHYYKVGHAALILIKRESGECFYYDFGRYHTPFRHGRARGSNTDPGLAIQTRADISFNGKYIENFSDILEEMQHKAEYHGEGPIYASYIPVDFNKAEKKAHFFQNRGAVPYGPLRIGGTNCSRFVRSVIRAGKPGAKIVFDMNFLVPFSPTPMNNVNKLFGKTSVQKKLTNAPFNPYEVDLTGRVKLTLPEPQKATQIPAGAKWLGGEGAGAWFHIEKNGIGYKIARYSDNGDLDFESKYEIADEAEFSTNKDFTIDYVSHYLQVKVMQNKKTIKFKRIKNA